MRVGPFNHHNDFNIRAHIFLCIFDGINETPVIFKWKYKIDEMPGGIDV